MFDTIECCECEGNFFADRIIPTDVGNMCRPCAKEFTSFDWQGPARGELEDDEWCCSALE